MLEKMGQLAREAAYQLANLPTFKKNQVLMSIADYLESESAAILLANEQDLIMTRKNGISDALLDRLTLNPQRLTGIANDVRQVSQLADPVGQLIDGKQLDNGLHLERRRVPLGVIGVIYEARPNVTVDVTSLCLKTGNAAILRGGKETCQTNAATTRVIQNVLQKYNLPTAAIQIIENPDHALVHQLLKLDRYIDMLIPRGGPDLHKLCRENSTIPVITGGIGVCHIYVDETMEIEAALNIIVNSKKQRPSACNSLETLLVNHTIAKTFLPALTHRMAQENISLHADKNVLTQLQRGPANIIAIKKGDYDQEWLSLDLNIKLVANITEAIDHIRIHGSQHSDAILTRSIKNANRFIAEVDSAAVYVNASTRFTDGGQFGLGAEVGVSTQKLHARGPMGLEALTTYKWIAWGDDTLRM